MRGRLLIVGVIGLGLLWAPASVASQAELPPTDLCAGFSWSEADKTWVLSYQLEYCPQAVTSQVMLTT